MTQEEILKLHDFYDFERTKSNKLTVKLDRLKIIGKLRDMGFYRFDINNTYQLVRIYNNIISITCEEYIIDAFEEYVMKLPTREDKIVAEDNAEQRETKITAQHLRSKLYQNLQSYFGKTLNRLKPEGDYEIKLLRDDKQNKYFFFNNQVIKVDKSGIHTIKYNDLDGNVWDKNVLTRDFVYSTHKGDFEIFIEDISSNDPARKKYLMELLGYLMHDHYSCENRAIIFTDGNTEAGFAKGGTGKGILGKALNCMLNRNFTDNMCLTINGKDIDLSKDTRYMLGDINTQLIHIEDLNKSANFEALYNDVTAGAPFRKFRQAAVIRMVKIMISANHTIKVSDNSSSLRRVLLFELADVYGANYTPTDKFGKRFFEESWTNEDWSCFDSFMCRCVQAYLSLPDENRKITSPGNNDYFFRELMETTNEDFVYYLENTIAYKSKEEIPYSKDTLYGDFKLKYPSFYNVQSKTLTKWTKEFFKYKNIPYVEYRSTKDMFYIYPTPHIKQMADAKKRSVREVLD